MYALFLSAALLACAAPPVPNLPTAPQTRPPRFVGHVGPATWTVVQVTVTDADVPADLVDATTRAMSAGIARQRLLFVLSKEAAAQGRPFVIVRGIRTETAPSGQTTAFFPLGGRSVTQGAFVVPVRNSLPPPATARDTRAKYRLTQRLEAASHLNADGTASLQLSLTEGVQALPGFQAPPTSGWMGESMAGSFTFHDGETQLLSGTVRPDGVRHLVFATLRIVPPYGRSLPPASSLSTKP